MIEEQRYCPLCDQWMDDERCPTHGIRTISSSTMQQPRQTLSPGELVAGRYEIIGTLGHGGMGQVYRARQVAMDRVVALKTLKADLHSDPTMLKRFQREARAVARLDHPNIVKVFDFGIDEVSAQPFIVMEYLQGRVLSSILREEGPPPSRRALKLILGVTKALVEAHEKGIIHRDLKPDNIIVREMTDGTEHVHVLDFGIARIREEGGRKSEKITALGAAVGTPNYMSPEQALGEEIDHRADLYSLGCILREVLLGEPPFVGSKPLAVLMAQVQQEMPPLPNLLPCGETLTDDLRTLVNQLTLKDRMARPESTLAVQRVIESLLDSDHGHPHQSPDEAWSFGAKAPPSDEFASAETHQAIPTPASASFVPTAGEIRSAPFSQSPSNQNQVSGRLIWALLVVAMAILTAVFISSRDEEMGVAQPINVSGSSHPTKETPPSQNRPTEVNSASPLVSEDAAPPDLGAAAEPTIEITSEPTGAAFMRGDVYLGKTPFKHAFSPADAQAEFFLQKPGFTRATLRLTSDEQKVHTRLERVTSQSTRSRSSAPTRSKKRRAKASPVGRCGDGSLGDGEQCDDGNLKNGDGCSKHCRIELYD